MLSPEKSPLARPFAKIDDASVFFFFLLTAARHRPIDQLFLIVIGTEVASK